MSTEKDSLLASAQGEQPKNFYFVQKTKSQPKEDVNAVEGSSNPIDYRSLELEQSGTSGSSSSSNGVRNPPVSWWSGLFRGSNQVSAESKSKPRKVPIKVEPKVFFANERTFLAWMHMSVTLASISVAIVAFAESNEWSQVYGLLLLPVAIAFCVYSLSMYIRRANMIRRKDPGPYEDKFGPIALAVLLGFAILLNFGVKLYDYAT